MNYQAGVDASKNIQNIINLRKYMAKNNFLMNIMIFLIFSTLFFAVYNDAILNLYSSYDAWFFLIYPDRFAPVLNRLWFLVQGGRPLYFAFTYVVSGVTHDLGALAYLRAFSIFGIAALATYSLYFMRQRNFSTSVTISIAMLPGLMPPFQVYAAWEICAPFSWAALLAAIAFTTVDRHDIGPRQLILSAALLTCSMAIYQPAAMMFWMFAGISWIGQDRIPKKIIIGRALSIMTVALIADYLLARTAPLLSFVTRVPLDRTTLNTDLIGKAIWFLGNPMTDALNLPSIASSIDVPVVVAIFIAGGMLADFQRPASTRIFRLILAGALLPLSYAPNLIVAESWSSYRTEAALTGLIAVYFCIALRNWLRVFQSPFMQPYMLAAACLGCAVSANRNVAVSWVAPQLTEYRIIADAVAKIPTDQTKNLYLVPSVWQDALISNGRYDEFGYPNSAAPWAVRPMVWYILRSERSPYTDITASKFAVGSGPAPAGATVIDFGKILRDYRAQR